MAFDLDSLEWWREHWKNMPEFSQENLKPFRTISVHFYTIDDMNDFFQLINQKFTLSTKYIWYPSMRKDNLKEMVWDDES